MGWTLLKGDCVASMSAMEPESVDAVVCDPPYGLEFMGKGWDRLEGEGWRSGGGMSSPGIGDRRTEWPAYGGGESANATCATCGGRMRGAKKCGCDQPDWRVKGAPLTAGVQRRDTARKQQAWHEAWATEALRVLKPGGHLLAFGGTRTYHRLASAVEDAGFEIRDSISWIYGSGFPKSLNISKQIDKNAGAEREVVGPGGQSGQERTAMAGEFAGEWDDTAAATDDAKQWEGWGTALKPSYEPIVVGRKPVVGTVAGNVQRHGTGGINIDATRIQGTDEITAGAADPAKREGTFGSKLLSPQPMDGESLEERKERFNQAQAESIERANRLGRWPPNVVLSHAEGCALLGTEKVKAAEGVRGEMEGSRVYNGGWTMSKIPVGFGDEDGLEVVEKWECAPGCPVAELDRQSGESQSGPFKSASTTAHNQVYGSGMEYSGRGYEDKGGASRFFYVAKASRSERDAGLDRIPVQQVQRTMGKDSRGHPTPESANIHPTVKPLDLMRWLVRLVTPPSVLGCPRCGIQFGEPASAREGDARPDAEAAPEADHMSSLPGSDSGERTCARCGSALVERPGRVLDPFCGSGTTGCAAVIEGFDFVGCELTEEYWPIIEARISFWEEQPRGLGTEMAVHAAVARKKVADTGQTTLL